MVTTFLKEKKYVKFMPLHMYLSWHKDTHNVPPDWVTSDRHTHVRSESHQ